MATISAEASEGVVSTRARALAEQIIVAADGSVTLPKSEWKGWTLSQEMADFEASRTEDPLTR